VTDDPTIALQAAEALRGLAPEYRVALLMTKFEGCSLDEAARTLQQAVSLQPDDAMKHYLLGVVQFDRGFADEARRELSEVLREQPDFEHADRARALLARLDG